jgi:hypothetical protein
MQHGEVPFFIPDAVVTHAITLTVFASLCKDIRTAYLEGRAYRMLADTGCSIRLTSRERFQMLASMWRMSGQTSIGHGAWFVLATRQALQRLVTVIYQVLHSRLFSEAW